MKIYLHSGFCIIALSLLNTSNLPAIAQSPLNLTSAVHPFDTPRGGFQGRPAEFEANPGDTLAAAASGQNATWYSGGVNNIHCSLLLDGVTWLGTDFGLKRLDLKKRTVRHYTSLDGLPHDRITAVASNGKEVFCTAINPILNGSVALCALDKNTGKWRTLTEQKIPNSIKREPAYYGKPSPLPPQWLISSKLATCLVPGDGSPGKPVATLYHMAGRQIERILSPGFITKSFAITTAQMDDSNLWLGTATGLLHYSITTHRWNMLLPDLSTYGSAMGKDGSLWSLNRTTDRSYRDIDRGMVRTEHWAAMHINGARVLRSFPLMDRVDSERSWEPPYLENITYSAGSIWVTVNEPIEAVYSVPSALPNVYRLDPKSGNVSLAVKENHNIGGLALGELDMNSHGEYDSVPASALANSHTGFGALTPTAMTVRFPGWICAAEETESKMLAGAPGIVSPVYQHKSGWAITMGDPNYPNRQYLTQFPAMLERSIPSSAALAIHEPATCPVAIGESVYYLTNNANFGLRVWNRRTEQAESIPAVSAALEKYPVQMSNQRSMRAGNDALWILSGDYLLRYGLTKGDINVFAGSHAPRAWSPSYVLLSVEGDTAWVKGAPNELFKAAPGTGSELTAVPIPALPAALEAHRNRAYLMAFQDNIAWFSAPAIPSKSGRVLIGYDLLKHAWTQPMDANVWYGAPSLAVITYKQGPICWFTQNSGKPSVYGYNSQTSQWTTLPPVVRQPNRLTDYFPFIGLDSTMLTEYLKEFSWDRTTGIWSKNSLPFKFQSVNDGYTALFGHELYIASDSGMWAYDIVTRKSVQSPEVNVNTSALNFWVMAYNSEDVWLVARGGATVFTVRFNVNTHAWRYWSEKDGVPQRFNKMTADGQSCWIQQGRVTYHLDTKTDKWENVSKSLSNYGDGLPIRQVLVDGDNTWLLTDPSNLPDAVLADPSVAPIYRYRSRTGDIEPVFPESGKRLKGKGIVAANGTIYLAAAEGVYKLNRTSGNWEPIKSPMLPVGLPALAPVAAREDANNIWIVGNDNALRYSK